MLASMHIVRTINGIVAAGQVPRAIKPPERRPENKGRLSALVTPVSAVLSEFTCLFLLTAFAAVPAVIGARYGIKTRDSRHVCQQAVEQQQREDHLKGDRAVVRAEMQAMESRIDTSLAHLREDMAKREVRMPLAIAVMFGLAIAILGFIA